VALISEKHNFIFIHIFRCGGNSIRKMLGAPAAGFPNGTLECEEILGVHSDIHDVKSHLYNSGKAEFYDNAFKFLFVRNPFSWLVSTYEYIRRHPGHNFCNIVKPMNYLQFLHWYVSTAMQFDRPHGANKYQFLHDFMSEDYQFVGKLEQIADDMIVVSKNVGIHYSEISKINGRKEYAWRGYYTEKSITFVNKYFSHDLELFNYSW
jgi:hypothetical protein